MFFCFSHLEPTQKNAQHLNQPQSSRHYFAPTPTAKHQAMRGGKPNLDSIYSPGTLTSSPLKKRWGKTILSLLGFGLFSGPLAVKLQGCMLNQLKLNLFPGKGGMESHHLGSHAGMVGGDYNPRKKHLESVPQPHLKRMYRIFTMNFTGEKMSNLSPGVSPNQYCLSMQAILLVFSNHFGSNKPNDRWGYQQIEGPRQ